MSVARSRPALLAAGAALAVTGAVAVPATAATGAGSHAARAAAHHSSRSAAAIPSYITSHYVQTNLVADTAGKAQTTDPNLVNPWGASFLGSGPIWVSDTGTGLSTLYAGGVDGSTQTTNPLVVSIPGALPTGQVSNSTSDFVVNASSDHTSGPAKFIFVGLTGHITGWSPTVGANGAGTSTHAEDARVVKKAAFTGLAMGTTSKGPRLYAANFASGHVDMYDGSWKQVHVTHAFRDRTLPKHYAPFNVMVDGKHVYVAYAKRGASGRDEHAAGLGRVDIFSLNGTLLHRVHAHSALDAPWGMAIAPTGFGSIAGDLVVGNFGNGRVHAFHHASLSFVGALTKPDGHGVKISGLWSLLPGNGTEGGTDELVFTAGPGGEAHGLLGTLSVATP